MPSILYSINIKRIQNYIGISHSAFIPIRVQNSWNGQLHPLLASNQEIIFMEDHTCLHELRIIIKSMNFIKLDLYMRNKNIFAYVGWYQHQPRLLFNSTYWEACSIHLALFFQSSSWSNKVYMCTFEKYLIPSPSLFYYDFLQTFTTQEHLFKAKLLMHMGFDSSAFVSLIFVR